MPKMQAESGRPGSIQMETSAHLLLDLFTFFSSSGFGG